MCTDCHHQIMQHEYTMEPEVVHNPYHIPIVGAQLTRNIGASYSEIRDEITKALHDVLDLTGNGEHLAVIRVRYL